MLSFLSQRLRSFRPAIRGLGYVCASQHNMWIHLGVATATIALGLMVQLTSHEWLAIVIAIALVMVSETFNTAVECLGDAITDQMNNQVGLAKDAGAAAVLLASMAAVVIGLLVFLPHCW